jgi:hypothetical protein
LKVHQRTQYVCVRIESAPFKMIGSARSEKADVSMFDDLVQLLGGVTKGGGTPIDDALGRVLKLVDMLLSTVCEFCRGKSCWVREDSKVEGRK